MTEPPVIGIDFGNAYCSVAIVKNGHSEVVADSQGERQLPGFVGFYPDLPPLVGREAERRLARYWKSTVFDFKLLLGKSVEDVQNVKSRWGFKTVSGKKGMVNLEVETQQDPNQRFSPQDVLSKVFGKLKETSEEALHQKVTEACITVPVDMTSDAREALQEAANLAGFEKINFISDPAAAVLAYDLDLPDITGIQKQIVVVDFGASLSVSLVQVQSGLIRIIQTETAPITSYAIEKELLNHFGQEFRRKSGFDYTESRRAVFRLQSECERVKKDLSQMPQSNIQLDGFYEGCDLNSNISRARFEGLTENLLKGIQIPIQTVVTTAGGVGKIHSVIFCGGSCKIPKVQQFIRQIFLGTEVEILSSIDPLDVNARGAALQASLIAKRNPMLKQKRVVSSSALSIGLAAVDGTLVPVVPCDTVFPTKIVKTFGIAPNQSKVLLSIYEGNDPLAINNHFLGDFAIDCDPNAEKKLQVSFSVDNNGILKISANQVGSGDNELLKIEGVKNRQSDETVKNKRQL